MSRNLSAPTGLIRIVATGLTALGLAVLGLGSGVTHSSSRPVSAPSSPSQTVSQPIRPIASMGFSNVSDPRLNIAAAPSYEQGCYVNGPTTAGCRSRALAAINHAHALEHVRPMVLPRNFWTLPLARQTFVVTNLERTERGLPPFVGLTDQLNGWAQSAARHTTDPTMGSWTLAGGDRAHNDGSIWAADYNVLDADYGWMYQDGWSNASTRNLACTSPSAYGCWGHREIILGRYNGGGLLLAGTGAVAKGYAQIFNSDTELFIAATGPVPHLVYSWRQAVAAGAR